MAHPSSEEDGLLREWAPLTGLLQQIPLKAQRGLFTQNLNLTCVDCLPEFIAVGTNLGLVYWYDRKKGDLQRLRCENMGAVITCVKVISTVDYMVAAGNDKGIVTVFQIPKIPPDNLPESMKPKKNKQVQRYTISLHQSIVTTIEWSMNGMKLFSGDKNGLVVFTEIDFYMHLSKSTVLLDEKYEIVQLSYSQQLLLVSTLFRSIVCCHREQRRKVVQVGQKERKTLGRFGATFSLGSGRPQELVVYSSRSGLRVWLADKNGVVKQTLIYKEALMNKNTNTPLLNPAPSHVRQSRGDHQFGPLHIFHENLLVTYSSDVVYVLNPATITVVATVADLRQVQDVAVSKDEIFILEGERSLIRVAYTPETSSSLISVEEGTLVMIPDTLEVDEMLVHVMGSTVVQSMLADRSLTKKTVWDYVSEELKNMGYDMGENGGVIWKQKWIDIVRNYQQTLEIGTFNTETQYLSYYDTLHEIIEQNDYLKFSENNDEQLVKITEDKQFINVPEKANCDSKLLSSTSVDVEFEIFKMVSDDFSHDSCMLDSATASRTLSEQCDDADEEEVILVYPELNDDVNSPKSAQHMLEEYSESEGIMTVYHEKSENITYNSNSNDSINSFYTDECTDYQEQSATMSSISVEPQLLKKICKMKNRTVIISPKVNQSSRPIPTAGEAVMSLISRLHREDIRRERISLRRRKARIQKLEALLEEENIQQQRLFNKALLTLQELKQSV